MQQRPLFGSPSNPPQIHGVPASQRIYSVSELNAEFKFLAETTYPNVWIEGEISNFTMPASGHFYLSLKDDTSQIRAVMWKSAHRYLKWRPKNGMKVIVSGRLTIYEPRGEYQIEITQISPHGKGDLFAAFEQLKEKLQKEGLFDTKRKRPIPMLPKKLGIVTSPSGAAIRDILHVLNRRFVNLHIIIFPAKVQGEEAAPTIVEGIRVLNTFTDVEVLILARGGGSIEDLWPFNEERVARAIVGSRIPIISAVGHEIDTTIADFAADLRAATPSAAAEVVIGKKTELAERVSNLSKRMHGAVRSWLLHFKNIVHLLAKHHSLAGFPQKIHTHQQTTDDCEARLAKGLNRYYQIQSRRLFLAQQKISAGQLRHLIEVKRSKMNDYLSRIKTRVNSEWHAGRAGLARCAGKLDSLSPLAVLERGYSIACTEEGTILKESSQTLVGNKINVRLHRGKLKCNVTEVKNE